MDYVDREEKESLQYIMDGNGNFYRLDEENCLVVASSKETARVFTFDEAKERIGDGRKAKFYKVIDADSLTDMESAMEASSEIVEDAVIVNDEPEPELVIDTKEIVNAMYTNAFEKATKSVVKHEKKEIEFDYDIDHINWRGLAEYFLFVSAQTKDLKENLEKDISDIDKEICDLLHYIELYDLSDEEAIKTLNMVKEARQRRREKKDEHTLIDYFDRYLATVSIEGKFKGILTELGKLETRTYKPRKKPDLFKNMDDKKTNRTKESEPEIQENDSDYYEDYNEENVQEEVFVETIYDNKQNNWLEFAKSQMEFYQNAGQYMINLKIDIVETEDRIEQLMKEIEDASYNVTQGYKAFKELKDLRNHRKNKIKELEILRTMTECFDLNSMADALAYNVDEIEKIEKE